MVWLKHEVLIRMALLERQMLTKAKKSQIKIHYLTV